MRRIIAAAMGAGMAMAANGAAARAHAFLNHASPAVGSTVPAAPPVLSLSFTQELEPAFSSLTVTDQSGRRVDVGNPQIAAGHPADLQVRLNPLPPGTYLVSWHVVAVDTHPTEGNFTFQVAGR